MGFSCFNRSGQAMNFWQDQRVVVTGGAGFLGTHVTDALRATIQWYGENRKA